MRFQLPLKFQFSTVQCSTQHRTVKHHTVQHRTVQQGHIQRALRCVFLLCSALLIFTACTIAESPAPETNGAAAEPPEPETITTWYYYDQNNTDPEANERVGNFYLARTIPRFNEEFAGQYEWVNVPRDYNLSLDLVVAVQTGGEIPDVMRMTITNMPTFIENNTVQDLTEFITNAPWYDDLDPAALEACRGPDGNLYCVPVAESPSVVFYWSDYFPNGFPTTPDALFAVAEELQAEGVDALTYWGSTALDGEGTGRYFYQTISSFGGSYDDGAGNMRLNTPENIAAVEFMREVVARGYSSESVFVGSFEEEEAFKISQAAAFPTGLYSAYLYLNPLTAPDGTAYDTISSQDMENAVDTGDIALAPFVAPDGETPGCNNDILGFVIPNGAPNREGAEVYINWIMESENQVEWILNAGGGMPVSQTLRQHAAFQEPIFQQGMVAARQSDCKPWFGSLLKIPEAKRIIAGTLFDLIRSPDADPDIGAALQRAEDEYNALP